MPVPQQYFHCTCKINVSYIKVLSLEFFFSDNEASFCWYPCYLMLFRLQTIIIFCIIILSVKNFQQDCLATHRDCCCACTVTEIVFPRKPHIQGVDQMLFTLRLIRRAVLQSLTQEKMTEQTEGAIYHILNWLLCKTSPHYAKGWTKVNQAIIIYTLLT